MSLSHTTESNGTVFDLFSDTKECRLARYDYSGSGIVNQFECEEYAEGENFMFYFSTGQTMSSGQAWVLAATSAVLRGTVTIKGGVLKPCP